MCVNQAPVKQLYNLMTKEYLDSDRYVQVLHNYLYNEFIFDLNFTMWVLVFMV